MLSKKGKAKEVLHCAGEGVAHMDVRKAISVSIQAICRLGTRLTQLVDLKAISVSIQAICRLGTRLTQLVDLKAISVSIQAICRLGTRLTQLVDLPLSPSMLFF